MQEPQQTTEATPAEPAVHNFMATLLRAAWLAILLGVVMEALLLLFAAGFGIFPGLETIATDLVRQVSWSTFVCVGLAIGTAVSQARVPLMGVIGLLAAPLAFNISRSLHQGTVKALEIAGAGSDTTPVLALALLKALEYGCLGATIGWVGGRSWGGLGAHVSAGLVIGIVFGSAIVTLAYSTAPEPLAIPDLVSRGVNEILFPVGCALVLFSATAVGKRVAS